MFDIHKSSLNARRILRNATVFARYGTVDRYPITALLPSHARRAIVSRVCYFPTFNLFYARLPKCANSTIVRTLATHINRGGAQYPMAEQKMLFNLLPWPSEFERATKMTVLRDPVARAVSAWQEKGHHRSFIAKHQYAGDTTTPPTLMQFLEGLRDNDFYQNAHYLPQTDMIPGKLSDYDIGFVDQLDTFMEQVCTRVFGRYEGLQNAVWHKTNAKDKLSGLSADVRKLVETLYERDIELYERLHP